LSIRGFIIGMGGQSRHGKTALVGALTGVATDRSNAFAPLYLPSGVEAGVIDVPARERSIKNLIAGFTGIDMLLLVVAADEGVAAQTLEHLSIAELLGVKAAVVAVTKIDEVGSEQAERTGVEVGDLISNGPWRGSPIVPVSILSKEGLGDLVGAIEEQSGKIAERPLDFPTRLPIDRSFMGPDGGCVVTGTLWSGILTAGGELELLPSGEICQPRLIEVHGQQVTKALPGQRVAVNLAIPGSSPRRGDFLAPPASFALVSELIAKIYVLPGAPEGIDRRARLRFFHGTGHTTARIIPLDMNEIEPGMEAFARIITDRPIPAVFRDRFVLRGFRPGRTLAGGVVLETRRGSKTAGPGSHVDMVRLRTLAGGDDTEVIRALFEDNPLPLAAEDIAHMTQIGQAAAKRAIDRLLAASVLETVGAWRRVFYLPTDQLAADGRGLSEYLRQRNGDHPDEPAPPKDTVRAALWPHLSSSHADILFDHFENTGVIERLGDRLAAVDGTGADAASTKTAAVLRSIRGFAPHTGSEIGPLLDRLENDGQITAVAEDMYMSAESLDQAEEILTDYLLEAGSITVDRFQDLLDTTPENAALILDYFDRQNITHRVGDERRLCR
jgi:selenocysteine-specific elongation factor